MLCTLFFGSIQNMCTSTKREKGTQQSAQTWTVSHVSCSTQRQLIVAAAGILTFTCFFCCSFEVCEHQSQGIVERLSSTKSHICFKMSAELPVSTFLFRASVKLMNLSAQVMFHLNPPQPGPHSAVMNPSSIHLSFTCRVGGGKMPQSRHKHTHAHTFSHGSVCSLPAHWTTA